MSVELKHGLEMIMGLLMLGIIYAYGLPEKPVWTETANVSKGKMVVLIDPGHGGNDPGKVSEQNDLEKNINLEIALRLKHILTSQDVEVVMTREADLGLYEAGDRNKKRADMENRVRLADECNADILVSIHVNSYVDSSVSGAQVFYYNSSDKGRYLAKCIQEEVSEVSILNGNRTEKKNDSYYILRKASVPAVIVECGFLSNPEETALLKNEDYQEKMAWAIHMGIMKYASEYH